MSLETMNKKDEVFMIGGNRCCFWEIACFIDLLKYFYRVMLLVEKMQVLNGKLLFPFFFPLFVGLSHRLSDVKMRIKVMCIFAKGPVVIFDPITFYIGPNPLLQSSIIATFHVANNPVRVHLHKLVEMVPVLVNYCLYTQNILQNKLAALLLLTTTQLRRLKHLH